MMQVCEHEKCCGCMACVNICPKACIKMDINSRGEEIPAINEKNCIDCGLCQKVCPVIRGNQGHETKKVIAAWSTDNTVRKTSASGGIASEVYRLYALKNQWYAGCKMDVDHKCRFYLSQKDDQYLEFQNSKYVYSFMGDLYKKIESVLKNGEKAVMVGLPCQISGLKNYLSVRNIDIENLITIDLICHGIVPSMYLIEWIKQCEKKFHRHAEAVCFRNPVYETQNHAFTLADKKGEFYKKYVWEHDSYHFSYHHALDYRESCYRCLFASRSREGDLTLGDFSGLGKVTSFDGEVQNVSCILVNTDKGEKLIKMLEDEGSIIGVERPSKEAFLYETQLNRPSIPHKKRDKFLKYYQETKKFSYSVDKALKSEKVIYKVKCICGVYKIKSMIPGKIKYKLKKKMRLE